MATIYSLDMFRKTRSQKASIIEVQENTLETSPNVDKYGFDTSAYQIIRDRFGANLPNGGVIYNTPVYGMKIDAYGRGNLHGSIFQYKPKSNKDWNRPMPFPSDLVKVYSAIKKNKGKIMVLGYKSDPLMWMDNKCGVTKAIIRCANANGVQLVINTMSDLCAHDDYIALLKQGNHSINMNMSLNNGNDELERILSPGAPSLKRRHKAIVKLRDAGIVVTIKTCTLPDHMPKSVLNFTGFNSLDALKKYLKNA
jgi:hypothetical protein